MIILQILLTAAGFGIGDFIWRRWLAPAADRQFDRWFGA